MKRERWKKDRPAFSLFEVLIIIAILGFLIGLLLPLAAWLRESSARTISANNMKQIGLACHIYYDNHRHFPPGVDKNNFSTVAYLLPYLDQVALSKSINFKAPITANANAKARQTRISTLVSPLDPIAMGKDSIAPTNYLFNAGSQYSLDNNNGIFYRNSNMRFQQIPDGVSLTLLAVETLIGNQENRAIDPRRQHVELGKAALKNLNSNSGIKEWKTGKNIAGNRGDSWIDGRFLQGTFTGTRTLNDTRPDVSCGGEGGLSGVRSLKNGTNVAACDGSVRYYTGSSLQVWQVLSSRNDGQVAPRDW